MCKFFFNSTPFIEIDASPLRTRISQYIGWTFRNFKIRLTENVSCLKLPSSGFSQFVNLISDNGHSFHKNSNCKIEVISGKIWNLWTFIVRRWIQNLISITVLSLQFYQLSYIHTYLIYLMIMSFVNWVIWMISLNIKNFLQDFNWHWPLRSFCVKMYLWIRVL